jgi:hypothetical protein
MQSSFGPAIVSFSAYRLLPGSPAIDRGIPLRGLFGIDPGSRDFYGNRLDPDDRPDIGAHEYNQDTRER